jgi:DNA-binding response OmpR family regulator
MGTALPGGRDDACISRSHAAAPARPALPLDHFRPPPLLAGLPPMRILINEDDLPTRKMLRFVLEQQAGHVVAEAESSEEALELLLRSGRDSGFDLLISDLVLPRGADGLELVRRVRHRSSIPIMMVSGRGEIADRVRALKTGADDYLVKPFDPSELAARVEALLRRSRQASRPLEDGVIRAGDLTIDLTRHVATVAGQPAVHLTPTEVRLLLRLARPPGEVRSREELAEAIWGEAEAASTNAINTYIADLRRKLEPGAARPKLLQTVRGVGYRLSA